MFLKFLIFSYFLFSFAFSHGNYFANLVLQFEFVRAIFRVVHITISFNLSEVIKEEGILIF